MKRITLMEAVRENILKVGDEVKFNGSLLPQYPVAAVEIEESGHDEKQYIFRENNKFYFVGKKEDKSLRFIATRSTDSKIILHGKTGFENGLNIMNRICSNFYSNKSLGIFSTPLDKDEFTEYFLGEYEQNFMGKLTSRGEAFLATPYISKEKQKDSNPTVSYGFKCFFGNVQLVNGTSEYLKKLGIVPTISMYLPECIYFDDSTGNIPTLTIKKSL